MKGFRLQGLRVLGLEFKGTRVWYFRDQALHIPFFPWWIRSSGRSFLELTWVDARCSEGARRTSQLAPSKGIFEFWLGNLADSCHSHFASKRLHGYSGNPTRKLLDVARNYRIHKRAANHGPIFSRRHSWPWFPAQAQSQKP